MARIPRRYGLWLRAAHSCSTLEGRQPPSMSSMSSAAPGVPGDSTAAPFAVAALQLTAYFAGELTPFDLHSSQKARRSSAGLGGHWRSPWRGPAHERSPGLAPHPVRAEIFIPNGRGACSATTGVRAGRRGACPEASRERRSCQRTLAPWHLGTLAPWRLGALWLSARPFGTIPCGVSGIAAGRAASASAGHARGLAPDPEFPGRRLPAPAATTMA
jgi:hypothetical protein